MPKIHLTHPTMLCSRPVFKLSTIAATIAAVTATTPAMPLWAQSVGNDAKPQLEEVVVTAQRRQENQQQVPVAVTAAYSEDLALARVDDISNIQQISPSIKFDVTNSAANSANILIRGIGTVGNSRAFEGAVGVFIDGVYRTRAGQAMQNWLDIESLQVLRGPQGTLFGKNTSAGALILNSRAPDLEAVSVDYEFSAGNYGKRMVRTALNVPLNENTAVRIAGLWGTEDGYIDNPNGGDYNDRDPRAAKAQFLWQANDDLSVHLIVDWSEEQNNCCYGQVDTVDGPFQPLIDNLWIPAQGLEPPSSDFDDYEQVLSNDTDQTVKDRGAVLKVDWQLADTLTLSSVTGYRDWSIRQWGMDADFSGANILTINEALQTKLLSQEFTLNGVVDGFGPFIAADYVLGLYYADEDIDAQHQLLWGNQAQDFFDVLLASFGLVSDASEGLWSDISLPATSQSYAAFMHWNFDITAQWGLTFGVRYSKDEKEGAMIRHFFTAAPNTPFRLLGVQPGPEYSDSFDDQAVSGTLALKYQITDEMLAYASYSRGYKSGGVNIDNTAAGTNLNNPNEFPGAVPLDPTYKSEFIDGYELGLKSQYLNGRARTNVALFHDEITDLQIAQFIGTQFTIDNAPDAEVHGAEIENEFLLSDVFTLTADVTWLGDARFGDSPSLGSLAEREFAQAPEFSANLALTADQPISGDLSLLARLAASYSGEQYTNTSNDLKRDAVTEYNTSFGLHARDESWSLVLWCQNCSDERYPTQHFNSPLQGPDANAYVSLPRSYGLTWRGVF